jgi:hypothetical protein
MYKIVPFSDDLDLEEFYTKALAKGYENNSSRFWLKDCFRNEVESETWILYYKDKAVGSVAAHSFLEIGDNAYRIAARTCVLTDEIDTPTLRTRNQIITHQHATGQFLIPACIEWAGRENNLYITSNKLEAGSQRLVHNIYFPAMEKSGQVENCGEIEYRGATQTVWKLNVERFYAELNKYPRWN